MDPLLEKFRDEVCRNPDVVEHSYMNDIHWGDMSAGFFLANGATVEQAEKLSAEARYEHQYWQD